MSHNILLTGASGYLGGTLLAHWQETNLPPYNKLYALVRTQSQADSVQQYGAEPLEFDVSDPGASRAAIIDKSITIVYYLIDFRGAHTRGIIEALGEVKAKTGIDVHFLFTTGAKVFSSHAGAPTDRQLLDTEDGLYDTQRKQKPRFDFFKEAIGANNRVIEESEKHGVKSYIFAPCIVYGRGEGFGNIISIQTVAIVKAALATRAIYKVDEERSTWPVCHVLDNTMLYQEILRGILEGRDIGYGKKGYFLAASGSIVWEDLYAAIGVALEKRGKIDDATVKMADIEALEKMGTALEGGKEFVDVHLGGRCTFTAAHGLCIGWKAQHPPEHILQSADDEVELILSQLKD